MPQNLIINKKKIWAVPQQNFVLLRSGFCGIKLRQATIFPFSHASRVRTAYAAAIPTAKKNIARGNNTFCRFLTFQFSTKESLSEETFSEEEEQAQEHAEQEEFFIAEHEQQLAGTPDFLACFRFFIIKQTTNAAQTIIKESKTIFKIMQNSYQSADFTF